MALMAVARLYVLFSSSPLLPFAFLHLVERRFSKIYHPDAKTLMQFQKKALDTLSDLERKVVVACIMGNETLESMAELENVPKTSL